MYQKVNALPFSSNYLALNFEYEIFNINAFVNSGIFFCTIPGAYFFSATLESWDQEVVDIVLKQNDIWQAKTVT